MSQTRAWALSALVAAVLAVPIGAYAVSATDTPSTPAPSATAADDDNESEGPSDEATGPDDTIESDHGHAADASAAGRAHAEAMKAWARCVAAAASGPKAEHAGPPKLACGDKPLGPGLVKHATAGAAQHGRHGVHPRSPTGRGRGHSR